jgi:hypothetical protein
MPFDKANVAAVTWLAAFVGCSCLILCLLLLQVGEEAFKAAAGETSDWEEAGSGEGDDDADSSDD